MTERINSPANAFQWIDVLHPTREEIEKLGLEFGLHATSIQDCLDPEHLPKSERIGEVNFLILRVYDFGCAPEADTIQELTNKVAIFFSDKFLITVHRKDYPFITTLRERFRAQTVSASVSKILLSMMRETLTSYERPIDMALNQLESLEMSVFGADHSQPFKIEQAYYIKRRAAVFKRILKLSLDLLPKVGHVIEHSPQQQDLREEAESLLYYADELTDSVTSLINLHISLSSQKTNEASHRTNEVVRVLTIFSVFLLPLNLVTGIYGMNFEFMPELKWHLGYPMALGMVTLIVGSTFLWFKRKGWLK